MRERAFGLGEMGPQKLGRGKTHHDARRRVLAPETLADLLLRPDVLPPRVRPRPDPFSQPRPHPYSYVVLRKGHDRRVDLLIDFELAPPDAGCVNRVEHGAVDLPCMEVKGWRQAVGEREAEGEAEDIGAGRGIGGSPGPYKE